MRFRTDTGRFPRVDYNRTIRRAKQAVRRDCGTRCDVMTAERAIGVYRVVQDMNSLREPQLAIRTKHNRPFI